MLTTPPPSWATWQRIRNDVGVRQAERRPPVPVVARVVWADDGEEQVDALAVAWTSGEVLVEIDDRRCATAGAWLAARDVRRRPDTGLAGRAGSAGSARSAGAPDADGAPDAAEAGAVVGSGRSPSPTVEYRVERVPVDTTPAELARLLNACSADGWRFVQMVGAAGIVLTFVRAR